MIKRFMHKRERRIAMLNDNRVVYPFDWGLEYIRENPNGEDPRAAFTEFSQRTVENSDDFFHLPEITDFRTAPAVVHEDGLRGEPAPELISWTSAVETTSAENNTARAALFRTGDDRKSAVVILPHWNAQAGTYFDLAKFFNRVGVTALRLTLPYHEERMPPELERADYLVAPNVGLTLQSLRQSVVDTRAAARFLKQEGYERVGIVGTSIGSCVAFFAFVHDLDIEAGVFNHVSGYVADVVWEGLSTYHVKAGLEGHVSLDELREYWMPISPMAYMEKLAKQEHRPQRYIYTKYDLTFPLRLSREMMDELRNYEIEHDEVVIPCGHYTLGEIPWVYVDGYKIISFLRRHLRN